MPSSLTVIDHALRPAKDAVLRPLVAVVPSGVPPLAITACAAVAGLAAAGAAAGGWVLAASPSGSPAACSTEWTGRSPVAATRTSDLGGYLDFLLDVVVYTAIPLGVAINVGGEGIWAATALLLGAFYVNAVSWTYLSALLERRGRGASARGEQTAVTMPRGLIEGAETILLFAVILAVPDWAIVIVPVMAALVAVSAAQRALWATRELRGGS